MLKKILSAVLLVFVLAAVGCDEVKTETHKEVHDQPVGQPKEVVE